MTQENPTLHFNELIVSKKNIGTADDIYLISGHTIVDNSNTQTGSSTPQLGPALEPGTNPEIENIQGLNYRFPIDYRDKLQILHPVREVNFLNFKKHDFLNVTYEFPESSGTKTDKIRLSIKDTDYPPPGSRDEKAPPSVHADFKIKELRITGEDDIKITITSANCYNKRGHVRHTRAAEPGIQEHDVLILFVEQNGSSNELSYPISNADLGTVKPGNNRKLPIVILLGDSQNPPVWPSAIKKKGLIYFA